MNFIPYSRQHIDEKDIAEVVRALRSDFITQGPKTAELEDKLSGHCQARFAVVFNSGTSALHGAYFAAGLSKGDEFITSPITFVATANAGLYLGARPVFIDVEKETGNIDADKIEKKITKKTKLLVPVHYAGHPVDLEKVNLLAGKHNLIVIEDACHAFGAKYGSRKSLHRNQNKGAGNNWIKIGSCTYSDMTVLSFHPVKHITTGEGGAVLTNNREFYEKLLMFRNHGITKDKSRFTIHESESMGDWYYEMQLLGYNNRMTDIQAALGISQLNKLDTFVERRRNIAASYNKAFGNNPYFDLPNEAIYAFSSYHLYPIRLNDTYKEKKGKIFSKLREKGIGVQVHYIPIYLQPYYKKLGYKKRACPVAEDFYKREISIPVYPAMKHKEMQSVINYLHKVFEEV